MSKKIDIFDTAEMVNEDIEGTISLKMKTSLDDAIEEIGVARLKEALSQVRGLETPIVSVSFKRKTVKGLERFEVYDGERSLNDAEINIVIDTVKKLRPVTFDWKIDNRDSSGFIAQEVEEVIPNIVTGIDKTEDSHEHKSIKTLGLLSHVTKALQESIEKIETLEAQVKELQEA